MYPWIDSTWNPIRGVCPHECLYCYMKRLWPVLDNPPIFHKGDLVPGLFSPGEKIFVESSIDLFAEEIPIAWIKEVLEYCSTFPATGFLFQTKNPGRLRYSRDMKLAGNFIIGTTIETNKHLRTVKTKAPTVGQRYQDFSAIDHSAKMVSIEPVLEFDPKVLAIWMEKISPVFISIGADSKGWGLPEPNAQDLSELVFRLDEIGIDVRKKKNLNRIFEGG